MRSLNASALIIKVSANARTSTISKASKNWSDDEIHQKIGRITSQFSILECIDCAKAIRRWLRQQGISGKILKLKTQNGEDYILSDRLEKLGLSQSITTNGQHFGVEVRGQVFDNLAEQGQSREKWVQDFRCHSKQFIVTEIESW
ncbi:MAG: papain fold toxin domain-containing protein [Cyanobacteria bacterium J06555_13]